VTDDRQRRQGIDFGALSADLRGHQYPTTVADLIENFADYELEIADGTRTVRDVLSPLLEPHAGATGSPADTLRFESAAEVRDILIGYVDDGAIGRKSYSDRTPPAPGEDFPGDMESI